MKQLWLPVRVALLVAGLLWMPVPAAASETAALVPADPNGATVDASDPVDAMARVVA